MHKQRGRNKIQPMALHAMVFQTMVGDSHQKNVLNETREGQAKKKKLREGCNLRLKGKFGSIGEKQMLRSFSLQA